MQNSPDLIRQFRTDTAITQWIQMVSSGVGLQKSCLTPFQVSPISLVETGYWQSISIMGFHLRHPLPSSVGWHSVMAKLTARKVDSIKEPGIGSKVDVTLADARETAREFRKVAKAGGDPTWLHRKAVSRSGTLPRRCMPDARLRGGANDTARSGGRLWSGLSSRLSETGRS